MAWLEQELFPNIPAHSVIVLGNAKYHNAVVERKTETNTRKANVQESLRRHDVQFDGRMKKSERLWLVNMHPFTTISCTDVTAEVVGQNALRLLLLIAN